MPLEQVKASYDLKPPVCYQCGQPLAGEDSEPYRHQVTDILPVVAEVTEYRVHTLVCEGCGAETSAELPVGVPPTAFGPCLQAMVSLLSGRCHLSKRDAAEVMTDFFQAEVSLGAVPTLEQRTGQAIKAPGDEAHAYVKRQPLVHLDETGWREANQKAWLWLAATTLVTVFFHPSQPRRNRRQGNLRNRPHRDRRLGSLVGL